MINGAAKEIGRAAIVAVTNARGMEVAGAVDTCHVGEDIGQVFVFGVISVCIKAKLINQVVVLKWLINFS